MKDTTVAQAPGQRGHEETLKLPRERRVVSALLGITAPQAQPPRHPAPRGPTSPLQA